LLFEKVIVAQVFGGIRILGIRILGIRILGIRILGLSVLEICLSLISLLSLFPACSL